MYWTRREYLANASSNASKLAGSYDLLYHCRVSFPIFCLVSLTAGYWAENVHSGSA